MLFLFFWENDAQLWPKLVELLLAAGVWCVMCIFMAKIWNLTALGLNKFLSPEQKIMAWEGCDNIILVIHSFIAPFNVCAMRPAGWCSLPRTTAHSTLDALHNSKHAKEEERKERAERENKKGNQKSTQHIMKILHFSVCVYAKCSLCWCAVCPQRWRRRWQWWMWAAYCSCHHLTRSHFLYGSRVALGARTHTAYTISTQSFSLFLWFCTYMGPLPRPVCCSF